MSVYLYDDKNSLDEKEIEKKEEKRKATKVATGYYPEDERLDETFKDFLEMRKKKRVPNTDRAITLAINKLNDLAKRFDGTIDNEKAIKIIEQSILSGWTSIYPLKEYIDSYSAYIFDWDSVFRQYCSLKGSNLTGPNKQNYKMGKK